MHPHRGPRKLYGAASALCGANLKLVNRSVRLTRRRNCALVLLKLPSEDSWGREDSFSSFTLEEFLENLGADEIPFKNLHLDAIFNVLTFFTYKKMQDKKARSDNMIMIQTRTKMLKEKIIRDGMDME